MDQPHFPPVRAAFFDMDGLLINSEDIYAAVRNKVLVENGYDGEIPWTLVAKMQSRPGDQAPVLDFSGIPLSIEQYKSRQLELHQEHFPKTEPLPGVEPLLHTLKNRVASPPFLALVSSSQPEGFKVKTTHLSPLFEHFPPHLRVLGRDPRIQAARGKPAPDVYLLALNLINESVPGPKITPDECVVFEDSIAGVQAGYAAGMRIVWVPHAKLREIYRGHEEEIPSTSNAEDGTLTIPRALADGQIEILNSLEEFDYRRYGLDVTPRPA
ncbi:putative HAD superfamily hydrolase [Eremomyces bilateralis CBS 781.70]|uniref:HAD superfamily hydrolase n=1 Tax=Eremomyces bilateralis CBS 781.70 TaxID=1392243 RepID=A0A6G1FR75_9PEZI|nr:putative HAD superfamily hydrolase [Eremomyces bilateralis CBS 781.70]KAF1808236.1 putative HAD superfamily hydrolase [Eremomyces bilateralis CBS 781.70]